MAKLQYFAAIPDNSNWSTPFVKSFKMDIHSGDFAEFIPEVAGDNVTVTFEGTGFVYNAAGDFIDGDVTRVIFTSGSNDLVKLSGLNLSAANALAAVEDSPLLLFIDD